MKKLFISQPMNGRSDAEILAERKAVLALLEQDTHTSYQEIDSFIENTPEIENVNTPVWYLGHSLQKLAEADVAVFAPGWENKRGCQIEHTTCRFYNIPTFEMDDEGHFRLAYPLK